jgi:D-proline reductase (dithiol) PrdB
VAPDTSASFEEFKNSFSYGPRNDLNFKFLKGLSVEDTAQFFQELLWKLGDSYDDGDLNRLIQHAYQWQRRGYQGASQWTYDEAPFTPLARPLSQSRVALLSSGGHFVAGQDPRPFGVKAMTQQEAVARISEFLRLAPSLSSIPMDTPQERLRVRHGGYDIRGAEADHNVVLPLVPLRELEQEGLIGELFPQAYSFVGAAAQRPLLQETGPQWLSLFQEQQIDAILLVPV